MLNPISKSSPAYSTDISSSALSLLGLLAQIFRLSLERINLTPLYFSLDKTEALLSAV